MDHGFGRTRYLSARSNYVTVILVGAVGLGLVAWLLCHRALRGPMLSASATQEAVQAGQATAEPEPSGGGPEGAPLAVSARSSAGSSARPVRGSQQGAESGLSAGLLVTSLSQLAVGRGPVTVEQASAWKEKLRQLQQQGQLSIPAIREFLGKNLDINFGADADRKLMGYPSLRLALLDTLQKIGGPEAVATTVQMLQTTADPLELATATKYLEETEPDKYRQMAVNAAREALNLAEEGKWDDRDVKPLFELLRKYGGGVVAPDLEKASVQWKYYSAMALADLPDGQGIPALLRLAQPSSDPSAAKDDFILHILAKVSPQYPEARALLIDQARSDRIPASTWPSIASALAGVQFNFGTQFFDPVSPGGTGGTTYHLEANQNFNRSPVTANWSAADFNQHLDLINQLLAVTTDPAGIQALQNAKTRLSARMK